ncbi:MAG: heavy metal-binding domain-containing protein, partial [Bacteroidaceae bacterium]|nr:heavy metal-binding domain-containing protein [Bacteroidaceae bacterium]
EEVFVRAKETALAELSQRATAMGANAVIGISINYATVGASGSMLMVTCTGTAVVI